MENIFGGISERLDQGVDINVKLDQAEIIQLGIIIFAAVTLANIVANIVSK